MVSSSLRGNIKGVKAEHVPRTRIGDEPDRVPFEGAQGDRQAEWLRYLATGHVMERAHWFGLASAAVS